MAHPVSSKLEPEPGKHHLLAVERDMVLKLRNEDKGAEPNTSGASGDELNPLRERGRYRRHPFTVRARHHRAVVLLDLHRGGDIVEDLCDLGAEHRQLFGTEATLGRHWRGMNDRDRCALRDLTVLSLDTPSMRWNLDRRERFLRGLRG